MQRECSTTDGPAEQRHAVKREHGHSVSEIGLQGGIYVGAGRVVAAEYAAGLHTKYVGGERILLRATDAQALAGWGKHFSTEGVHWPSRLRSPEREVGRERIPAAIQMEYIVRYQNQLALHAARGECGRQPIDSRAIRALPEAEVKASGREHHVAALQIVPRRGLNYVFGRQAGDDSLKAGQLGIAGFESTSCHEKQVVNYETQIAWAGLVRNQWRSGERVGP